MRKIVLGLVATAAIAAPLALAGSANADTAGVETTTYSNGTSYHHAFTAVYTCGIDAGHTVINFTMTNDVARGTGVLTPATDGSGAFAFSGDTGGYPWSYSGTYGTNGGWTDAHANAGTDEVYGFGDGGRTETLFGSVVGSFSGVPNCPAPEVPATVTGNHGEYVSGATKAGIKGKDLAAIAKDVTLVGPYKKG